MSRAKKWMQTTLDFKSKRHGNRRCVSGVPVNVTTEIEVEKYSLYLQHYPAFISDLLADKYMRDLCEELAPALQQSPGELVSEEEEIMQLHRSVCAIAHATVSHIPHTSRIATFVHWTPTMTKLREVISKCYDVSPNLALVSYYRDGNDYAAWCTGDVRHLVPESHLLTLTFGETRTFVVECGEDKRTNTGIEMNKGSLLIMSTSLAETCQRSVSKKANCSTHSMSITFMNAISLAEPLELLKYVPLAY